jgi:hypothetical protein
LNVVLREKHHADILKGKSLRTWSTPPAVAALDPAHQRATKALANRRIREADRDGVVQHLGAPPMASSRSRQ